MTFVPGFWKNETSGALRPAVIAYFNGEPMDDRQVAAIRAYLRQWMQGDWKGPLIDPLRTQVEEIATREDIGRWLDRALEMDIDPF
jgi:hypothetical protein